MFLLFYSCTAWGNNTRTSWTRTFVLACNSGHLLFCLSLCCSIVQFLHSLGKQHAHKLDPHVWFACFPPPPTTTTTDSASLCFSLWSYALARAHCVSGIAIVGGVDLVIHNVRVPPPPPPSVQHLSTLPLHCLLLPMLCSTVVLDRLLAGAVLCLCIFSFPCFCPAARRRVYF